MITVKRKLEFVREAHGRRRISTAPKNPKKTIPPGRIPRVSRLIAIAHRLESLLRSGAVSDVQELADIGHVTQPRISQILALTFLAPDIQEELLFLPRLTSGRAKIHEKLLRKIVVEPNWDKQREMWRAVKPPQER